MNAESSNHTHYRAKCPKCSHPNTKEIPTKQTRKTLDFTCSYQAPGKTPCGAKYTVYVSDTETFTPEQVKVKPYMNRAEREAFIATFSVTENFINSLLHMPNLPESTKYAYKEAQEWLAHGAYEWMISKETRTIDQLKREAKLYKISLVLKRDAKETAKKNAAIDAAMRNEIVQEDRDVILDLALATFQHCCRNCDGSPEKEGCPIKYALDKLDMPPWDAVDTCHYAYSGLLNDEIAEMKNH